MTEHFAHHVTVRYLEVDQQGAVFNMWYLAYFDDAMTAFLAARGAGYPAILAAGLDFQLVHTEIDWARPLRFGDPASVEVSCESLGRTTLTLRFRVTREDQPIADGRTVYVLVAVDGAGKQSIPDWLRAALAAEGGPSAAPA